jgi:hypothetical protein
MSVEVGMAGLTVYGATDGSYRPWLPLWHEWWHVLNEVSYQFIVHSAGMITDFGKAVALTFRP